MATTNVKLTKSYVKIIDSADTAWKFQYRGVGTCEFVYSTTTPATTLVGHLLFNGDGISVDTWGSGNVYARAENDLSIGYIVITK